jgi:protein SCO1/2
MSKLMNFFIIVLVSVFIFSCNSKEKVESDEHSHNDTTGTAECCSTDEEVKSSEFDSNNSLYDIDLEFTDMNSETVNIEDFKGKYLITSMIFTQCEFACPTIVNNTKDIQNYIKDNADFQYVMVSFDHKRDTPSQLKSFYKDKNLNEDWHLLTGTSSNIRIFSMIFDISYQELDNGDFSHSNAIFLVDKNGKILDMYEGLKINTKEVANKILEKISKN